MREELIQSAISFLSSDKVRSAEKEKKIQFLKSKGLNEEEINEAFKRLDSTNTIIKNNTLNSIIPPKLPPRPVSYYRPTQIVYYTPDTPRMTSKQIFMVAIMIGFGLFSATSVIIITIKRIMTKILNSIAQYQRDRYNDHRYRLSRIDKLLKDFSKDVQPIKIEKEQERLVTLLNTITHTLNTSYPSHTAYTDTLSTIDRFRNTLSNDPNLSGLGVNTRMFGPYSGFETAYAERYQASQKQTGLLQEIKSDIRSLKGILLSRKNFPTANRTVVPPPQTDIFIPPPPTPENPDAYHPRHKAAFRKSLNNS